TQQQVFRSYVAGGGKLVAMRPDPALADLFGLTYVGPRAEQLRQFFAVDTTRAPGAGITPLSVQYHGAADNYTLNGATALASLWTDITTPSATPAVALYGYGSGQ